VEDLKSTMASVEVDAVEVVKSGGGGSRGPMAVAAVKTGGASYRSQCSLLIGLELGCRWGKRRLQLNLILSVSTPSLYSTARWGAPTMVWVGRPRSGRGSKAQVGRWAN
jgi:hypothetical protein